LSVGYNPLNVQTDWSAMKSWTFWLLRALPLPLPTFSPQQSVLELRTPPSSFAGSSRSLTRASLFLKLVFFFSLSALGILVPLPRIEQLENLMFPRIRRFAPLFAQVPDRHFRLFLCARRQNTSSWMLADCLFTRRLGLPASAIRTGILPPSRSDVVILHRAATGPHTVGFLFFFFHASLRPSSSSPPPSEEFKTR